MIRQCRGQEVVGTTYSGSSRWLLIGPAVLYRPLQSARKLRGPDTTSEAQCGGVVKISSQFCELLSIGLYVESTAAVRGRFEVETDHLSNPHLAKVTGSDPDANK